MSTSEYSQSPSTRSAAPSVDAAEVERAKREIQGLVQEIAELSRSQIAPAEFYEAMLNKIVAALAAPGGAVWMRADSGAMQLAYQINLRQTGLIENQIAQAQHGRLLSQVLVGAEGTLVAPHSGPGDATDNDENAAANPTDFLLVLAPVLNDQGPQGVVEVFQRPGARITTQRGYLRFLMQICELAGDFLKGQRLAHLAEKQSLWEQLETFTRAAHEKLDVRQTAYTIVNEGRRLIGCDRVSLAIRYGGKATIEAVSGQDTFDKRSNVTTLLNKLATAVTKTGEDVWYTGDTSDMAPQVEAALDAYVDESHTKAMAILPILEPRDEEEKFAGEDDRPPAEVIGALIVEQMVDSRTPDGFMQRVNVVRTHSSTALWNALQYEGLFLMPLWRFLGKGKKLFRGRTLPKTVAAIAATVGAIAFLSLYPADFTLEGSGELKPTIRRKVFAKLDAEVQEVAVTHDQPVREGEVLAVLQSRDLDKEIVALQGDLQSALADQSATNAQLISEELTPAEASQKEAHLGQLQAKIESLRLRLSKLEDRRKDLEVRSPIAGRVVTWKFDLEELLKRPISRGNELMEIADPTSDWELELSMPESRMGHIAEAWSTSEGNLEVTFFLAMDPSTELKGRVVEIPRSAEVKGEQGNTVRMRVALDQEELRKRIGEPVIGASAAAKVHCGTSSIGYKYLHDLFNFIRAKILFRL